MKKENYDTSLNKFYECVLMLKSVEDCQAFFSDVCTVKELQAISQRLEVAGMLFDGKKYVDIEAKTSASTATISRVNRSLQQGGNGYELVLKKNV